MACKCADGAECNCDNLSVDLDTDLELGDKLPRDLYLRIAGAINAIDRQINEIARVRKRLINRATRALNDMIVDEGVLSNLVWDFERFDDNDVLLCARACPERDDLVEWIKGGRQGDRHYMYLAKDEDGDSVVVELRCEFGSLCIAIHAAYLSEYIDLYQLDISPHTIRKRLSPLTEQMRVLMQMLPEYNAIASSSDLDEL